MCDIWVVEFRAGISREGIRIDHFYKVEVVGLSPPTAAFTKIDGASESESFRTRCLVLYPDPTDLAPDFPNDA